MRTNRRTIVVSTLPLLVLALLFSTEDAGAGDCTEQSTWDTFGIDPPTLAQNCSFGVDSGNHNGMLKQSTEDPGLVLTSFTLTTEKLELTGNAAVSIMDLQGPEPEEEQVVSVEVYTMSSQGSENGEESAQYFLRLLYSTPSGGLGVIEPLIAIPVIDATVAVVWLRKSEANNTDGLLELWLGANQHLDLVGSVSGLENSTQMINTVRLGSISNRGGPSGTIVFSDFGADFD